MKLLALTCEALSRSIYALAAQTPHTVTVSLYKQGLHNRPKNLREVLQSQIDEVPAGEYDAILLVYGMCGRSTIGLVSPHTQMVIPRAHDCITLYLGSRERYKQEFDRHPGTYWYSVDYMERQGKEGVALGAASIEAEEEQYEKYVAKYGKETADELMEEMRQWSQHYTRAAFIDTGINNNPRFEEMARGKAEREGWVFERLEGNRRILQMLVEGNWDPEEILVVPPNHTIQMAGDDSVMRAVPVA